jgi:hypothetical protein
MTLAAIPNTRLRSTHIESEQSASRRYASFTSAVGCREWFPRSKRILPTASRRNSWYKVEVRSCPASGGDDDDLGASCCRLVAMLLPRRSECGQYRPAGGCLLQFAAPFKFGGSPSFTKGELDFSPAEKRFISRGRALESGSPRRWLEIPLRSTT